MSDKTNGAVLDTPTKTATTGTIGTPGLVTYGGIVWEEWDRRLQADKGLKAYRQMLESDPICAAMAFGIEAMIRAPGHALEDADESDQAKEITAFVETCFQDMFGSWGDTVSEILSCLWLGFSVFEVAYKVRQGWVDPSGDDPGAAIMAEVLSSRYGDGKIGWAYWSPRSQETISEWVFDPATQFTTAFWQQVYSGIPGSPSGRIGPIPLSRCLHFRIQPRKQSPTGISLFRGAYEPWYYSHHLTKVEAITAEKSGVGTLKLYAPDEQVADPAKKAELERMVSNFHVNEQQGFVLSSMVDPETKEKLWDAVLMAAPGQNVIDLDKAINRHDRDKLLTLLMQFALLGQGTQATGSYAQSISSVDFFMLGINVIQDTVADIITTQGIDRLVRKNRWPVNLAPTFRFKPVKRRDLAVFAEAFAKVAQYINTKRPETRRVVYDELEIPVSEKSLQDEIAEEEAAREQMKQQTQAQPTPIDQSQQQPATPGQQVPPATDTKPAKAATFAEPVVVEISDADIAEAVAAWDRIMPEHAGMLGAKQE